jgi:hypothetical protein
MVSSHMCTRPKNNHARRLRRFCAQCNYYCSLSQADLWEAISAGCEVAQFSCSG